MTLFSHATIFSLTFVHKSFVQCCKNEHPQINNYKLPQDDFNSGSDCACSGILYLV